MDLDLVDTLNRVFPDTEDYEQRFASARSYTEDCRRYLGEQLAGRKSAAELRAAAPDLQAELRTLQAETRNIQSLGSQTLANVHSVTREIKRLDTTKENLMSSIRMLRQLKMLTKLYLQLDILLKERRYEDMVGAVKAASDLTDYFRPFRPLPQISKLSQEIGQMETKVYTQVEADLAAAIGSAGAGGANGGGSAITSACAVLDSLDAALGQPLNRNRLIRWYCTSMLAEYSAIFSPQDEAGSLENVKRRYTYLKNKVVLRYMASHEHLFPPEWPVKQQLVQQCGEVTTRDLLAQLPQIRSSDGEQIQTLLATIYESLDFENFVKTPSLVTPHLMPYLSLWVDFQDRQIAQRILGYARSLTPPGEVDEVIPSSRELVNFYRALLTQLAQIKHHERRTVAQLAEVMALHLSKYASKVLMAYLPDEQLQSVDDLRVARVVNATADYILTTTNQLERTLRAQLGESEDTDELIDAVFEQRALSMFRQVGIRVENLIVQYIRRSLEPMWFELASHYTVASRSGLDVSSVSPYTSQLVSHISRLLKTVFEAPALSPAVIYGVATRTAEAVSAGFLTMAMARVSKPLGESLVEQMLLDLGSIKTQGLLAPLEELPQDIKEKKGASRLDRINSKILDVVGQAEAVLKVLLTPAEPMETFVRNYHVLIKDRSTLNFRKILDVKGVRFQPRAIEKFKLLASQDPALVAENTLLRGIPTVPPPSQFENQFGNGSQGFGFRRIGDFLRRDH